MKIIAIKDMSAGNEEVGEMWQETKIFEGSDKLEDVVRWAGTRKKRLIISLPDGEEFPDKPLPF